MAYPRGYKPIHLRESLHEELMELDDFGPVGIQEKINQLLRFYKYHKKKNVQ